MRDKVAGATCSVLISYKILSKAFAQAARTLSISGKTVTCINLWLKGRNSRITAKGHALPCSMVITAVVQEPVLELILFSLSRNDLQKRDDLCGDNMM